MNPVRWLGIGVFAVGVALLAVAIARGEAVLYLVLIFPVVQATGPIAFGAIAGLFAGTLLVFVSIAMGPRAVPVSPGVAAPPPDVRPGEGTTPPRTRAGGVVFLGPVPIIFGSDTQVAKWMIVVAAVLFVLLVAFWIAVVFL